MRKLMILLALSISVTGCKLFDGAGSTIGWNDAIPPVTDGVGRIVDGDQLSQLAITVTPDMLETLDTYESVSAEKNDKYKAGIEATFKKITASADLEFVSGKKMQSDRWKIVQLKDFSTAVVDTEFAYRCLTAERYKYTIQRKTTAGVKLDATELVKKFDAAGAAKVEIGILPSEPDQAEVTVNNPNVCLAFVSAIFKRDRYFSAFDGPRLFQAGNSTSFTLTSSNGVVASAEPDFGKKAIHTKPTYKLIAVSIAGVTELQIKVFDSAKYKNGLVIPIPELIPGTWDQKQPLPPFAVGNNVYGFMYIVIKAKRTAEGGILVSSAELYSPEFKLKTK